MIKGIITKGIIKFAEKYITKDESKAIMTYIVRDCETEKSRDSIYVKAFIETTAEPFKVGDTVKIEGRLTEQFKRKDGEIVKDDNGRFITQRWEIIANTIVLLASSPNEPVEEPVKETPENANITVDALPFELTEEQKAQLSPEMRKTLGL